MAGINQFAPCLDTEVVARTFYARKQLLLSGRRPISHYNISAGPSVCHTGGSVKNGAS